MGNFISDFFKGDDSAEDMANQARAEEAAREARMQSAVDQINMMFGVRPSPVNDPNAAARKSLQDRIAQYEAQIAANPTQPGTLLPGRPRGVEDDPSQFGRGFVSPEMMLAGLQSQLATMGAAPDNAARNTRAANKRKAREAAYRTSGRDIMNYYRTEADEQKKKAASTIAIDMARRGLTAGSTATGAYGGLTDDYNDQIQRLKSSSDEAVSGMRTADEDARLGLISRIRQGMDVNSAISGANTALQNSIRSATESAKTAPLEDLFRNVEDFYGQRRAYDAYQAGADQVRQGVRTPGSSGTVSTGTIR